MAFFHINTLRRARSFHAIFWHISKLPGWRSSCKALQAAATSRLSHPHLSVHLARDIGIDPVEFERRRQQLPSQTTHHPRG